MDDRIWILFALPWVACLGLFPVRWRSLRVGNPPVERIAWAFLLNHAVFNLFFVWSWEMVGAWRAGVLSFSTGLVILASLGQLLSGGILRFRDKQTTGWVYVLLVFFLNLPLAGAVIWTSVARETGA
jgi:hypothetical protein